MTNVSARQHRYLIGIGSNIEPQKNVPLALEKLCPHVTHCMLSRAIQTEPVGMVSTRQFLNMIAYLESDLDVVELKALFNTIEAELGRDRSDPHRKVKDRPIDLDIWVEVVTDEDWVKSIAEAPEYSRLILVELLAHLPYDLSDLDSITVPLQVGAVQCGHQPTSLSSAKALLA